ncbi:MAG: bacterial regulatory s, gntR family protein [Rhizobacter sp.]|nr:bacterial regulatory s, gntR family protein [Rhizobacter sp.]
MPPRSSPHAPASTVKKIEADGTHGLGLITVPKSCNVLAERLRAQILDGTYPPGAPLPTERELVQATGLSRGSVREALRILEAQGLALTKPGRYGGTVAVEPSDESLGGHINSFAKMRGLPLQTLVEARQALDPMIAYLAAKNRTEHDLAQLKAISARLDAAMVDDVPRFLEENANWHSALAIASHNDLLRAFKTSISALMLDASRIENFANNDVRQLVTLAHRRLLQAIEAQDAPAARRRSERDVQAYAEHLEAAVRASAGPKQKKTT